MYIVAGIYPPPTVGQGRAHAELRYTTLDEAMQKLRDWIEADELDCATGGDGPMFIEYALRIDLPLKSPHQPADQDTDTRTWPPLRLA